MSPSHSSGLLLRGRVPGDGAAGEEVEEGHLAAGDGGDVVGAGSEDDPAGRAAVEARVAGGAPAEVDLAVRVGVAGRGALHAHEVDAETLEVLREPAEADPGAARARHQPARGVALPRERLDPR